MTYFINEKERCIVNAKNGDIIRPACFDDLILYYNYVQSTDGEKAATQLLKRVSQGEKVISDMVAYNSSQEKDKK